MAALHAASDAQHAPACSLPRSRDGSAALQRHCGWRQARAIVRRTSRQDARLNTRNITPSAAISQLGWGCPRSIAFWSSTMLRERARGGCHGEAHSPWPDGSHGPDLGHTAPLVVPDLARRLHDQQVPAHGLSPQLIWGSDGRQTSLHDQRHHVALLRLADVLRGDQHRPAGIAQPARFLPDTSSQKGIQPGGGLVEEQQVRIVDHGRGELEASLHSAGEAVGAPTSDVPQVHGPQHLAGAPPSLGNSSPNRLATKSTFFSAVRSGDSEKCWGM